MPFDSLEQAIWYELQVCARDRRLKMDSTDMHQLVFNLLDVIRLHEQDLSKFTAGMRLWD